MSTQKGFFLVVMIALAVIVVPSLWAGGVSEDGPIDTNEDSRPRKKVECTMTCQVVKITSSSTLRCSATSLSDVVESAVAIARSVYQGPIVSITVVGRISRTKTGSDQQSVCAALRKEINDQIPQGHYKRHCKCRCKEI